MPDSTFDLKGEKCTTGKYHKDRVMVLVGGNADGTGKKMNVKNIPQLF